MGVRILPGPPTNATVVHNTTTEVELTWDASPTPVEEIASYSIFFKEITDSDYPVTPQITRNDLLANYSEVFAVTAEVLYDFVVVANANIGLSSSLIYCDSCHVNNTLLCGNGVIDGEEECDGLDLGDTACEDVGLNAGLVACTASCEADYGECTFVGGGGGGSVDEDNIPPMPGEAGSPEYASTSPFAVTYSKAVDAGGSGLNYVTLLYKKGTSGWIDTGLTSSENSGSFDFVPDSSPNATYYFGLQAFDLDGNQSDRPVGAGDTSTLYDTELPTIGAITVPEATNGPPITITYENAIDVGISGFSHVEIWYRQGEDGDWLYSGLSSTSPNGAFDFEFDTLATSDYYYFDVIAFDRAGNESVEDSEYQSPTIYDKEPPDIAFASVSAILTAAPIVIDYEGALDIGPAGLKQVELWYKDGVDGTWTDSGLTANTVDGSLEFIPEATEGNFHFFFVLEDNLGNRSNEPSGDGFANVIFSAEPFAAVLSNLPDDTIAIGSVDIGVGGDDIIAYQFKINDAQYSEEIPIDTNIVLTDLAEGDYSLNVIGKSSLDLWQDVSNPTSHTWIVDALYIPGADEGETDELIEEEVSEEELIEEEISEEEISEELVRKVLLGEDFIHHCENRVMDEDEENINCGGLECPVCIDVYFSVQSKPMARPFGAYESSAKLNLFSRLSARTIRSTNMSMDTMGELSFLFEEIPANTYNIGMKSEGYLQRIIPLVALEDDLQLTGLDFTAGGTFSLIGGDIINDNVVNAFDLAVLLKNYLSTDKYLDMNRDGFANAADLAIVVKHYQVRGDTPE